MRRILCAVLALLLPLISLAEEEPLYQGDGQYMLTVMTETACSRTPFGEEEFAMLQPGMRVLATSLSMTGGNGEAWHQMYLPGQGYGYVSGADVVPDEPKQLTYHPGFGVSTALFAVENPEAMRVEVVSLDGLEYPVVTLHSVYPVQEENGPYRFILSFDTASDVCKTTEESVCATLYGPDGEPVEAVTIAFFTISWRR